MRPLRLPPGRAGLRQRLPDGRAELVDYDERCAKAAAVKAQHNGKEGSGMSIDAALATFKGRE